MFLLFKKTINEENILAIIIIWTTDENDTPTVTLLKILNPILYGPATNNVWITGWWSETTEKLLITVVSSLIESDVNMPGK